MEYLLLPLLSAGVSHKLSSLHKACLAKPTKRNILKEEWYLSNGNWLLSSKLQNSRSWNVLSLQKISNEIPNSSAMFFLTFLIDLLHFSAITVKNYYEIPT